MTFKGPTHRTNFRSKYMADRAKARLKRFAKNNIKRMRAQCGVSLNHVAVSIGVTAMAVKGWEDGRQPSGENMLKLCQFFGCKPGDIWPHLVE